MNEKPGSEKYNLVQPAQAIEPVQAQLRAVLDATVEAVVIVTAGGSIETFNGSASRMFGYGQQEVIGRDVAMLLPPELRAHTCDCVARYRRTRNRNRPGRTREIVACRRDGTRFPALLSVSVTADAALIVGCVRDLTADRALQEEILHIAALEQRRIGQELHDGTQQELTGLGLLAQNLAEQLREEGAGAAAMAARLAAGIAEASGRVRSVARGLVPVPIAADSLPAALDDLARSTQESYRLACRLECIGRVQVPDSTIATHLYRIAQEAVGNAANHARADTVLIRLAREERRLRLEIRDDGIGIPQQRPSGGVGLRLMEHRCAAIGGRFRIESEAGGGTMVSCTVPVPG